MGKSYDKMLTMPIPKLILILSIPAIISNLISNVYNLVDTYFVGTLGVSASGAIGILFTLMAILQAIAFMFGQGAGTNISRRLAEKDEESASSFASIAIFYCVVIGLVFTFFGLIFIKPLMLLLGSTKTILPYAMQYGTMILISAPAIMASLAINNIFRYEGKTYLGMIGLSIGAFLNMGFDPLFIFVFKMGVWGAGLATALSQYISLAILLVLLYKKSVCKFSLKYVTNWNHVFTVIKNGFPSFIRQGLNSVASGVLNAVAGQFGDDCVSAISICSRLQGFMFSVGLGIGQGFQPVASFNYQKKEYKRLLDTFNFTLISSFIIFLVFSIISFMYSRQIVDIFIDDAPTVIDIGSKTLCFLCVGLCFLPISVTTNMLYQSTGKSLIASILATLRGGLCLLPYILILPIFVGVFGVQISNCLGDITASLISLPFIFIYFINVKKEFQNNTN